MLARSNLKSGPLPRLIAMIIRRWPHLHHFSVSHIPRKPRLLLLLQSRRVPHAMFSHRRLELISMPPSTECNAFQTMEPRHQSHHSPRTGLDTMPSFPLPADRPHSGHDKWRDQRAEVGARVHQWVIAALIIHLQARGGADVLSWLR